MRLKNAKLHTENDRNLPERLNLISLFIKSRTKEPKNRT
jgi:hypothetical protein